MYPKGTRGKPAKDRAALHRALDVVLSAGRDEFTEGDHPRAENGQFGSGAGGSEAKKPAAKKAAKKPRLRESDVDDVAQVLYKQQQGWTAEEIADNEGIDEFLVEKAMSGVFGKTPEDVHKYFEDQQAAKPAKDRAALHRALDAVLDGTSARARDSWKTAPHKFVAD